MEISNISAQLVRMRFGKRGAKSAKYAIWKLAMLLFLLSTFAAPAGAQTETVDFEQFSTAPSVFSVADPPLTLSIATLRGGQVLNAATMLPADRTIVYGTAYFCVDCNPTLTINFSEPVSDVSFLLMNGRGHQRTFIVGDDRGGLQSVTLAGNSQSGAAVVHLSSSDVRMVVIEDEMDFGWDFLIDNLTFTRQRQKAIEVILDPAPPSHRYVIPAIPALPLIRAKAKVVGVTPDPTASTMFTWSAHLSVDERRPPREVNFDSEITQGVITTGSSPYTLNLIDDSAVRGGRLKLTARAMVDGELLEGNTEDGLRIDGTNPQRTAIQREIVQSVGAGVGGLNGAEVADALQRVACQESRQRQFSAPSNGGIGGPLISFDDGVGIFQITLTDRCPDPFQGCRQVLFDWRANVQEGTTAFGSKVRAARRYPSALRRASRWRKELELINATRISGGLRPIAGVLAPEFTVRGSLGATPTNQLLEDTLRGYNGYGTQSLYGFPLHEFQPDIAFLERLPDEELGTLHTDSRFWKRVPADMRGNRGDRDYVDRVTRQAPSCGG